MDEASARKLVVEAGRRLVEAELVARTWGNVSCRIDRDLFAVTPSGMAYDTMSENDIVIVSMQTLKHTGPRKPSSETGIHAAVYRMRGDVNFVIHTHQINASAISGLSPKAVSGFDRAAYGLPGTARLRRSVVSALSAGAGDAIIMAHHGALCFGEDMEAAFQAATALEKRCGQRIAALTGRDPARGKAPAVLHISRDLDDNGALAAAGLDYGQVPEDPVFRAIFDKRADIGHIVFISDPEILAASLEKGPIRPLLDDMAQIAGVTLRIADWKQGAAGRSERAIVSALAGRHAVLVRGKGAYCCGRSRRDAEAVALIVRKGCLAYNAAKASGSVQPIHPVECRLMRWNYICHYSRQAAR